VSEKPAYLAIGQIVQPHGIKGELVVFPFTERENRFEAGGTVFLSPTAEGDESLTPLTIVSSRRHKGRHLLGLEGIADRTQAESYIGAYLVAPYEEAESAREADEFFLHALVGREVRSEAGERLGVVAEVVETGGHPLLEIEGAWPGRRLLPFVKEFVRGVEDEAVVVAPPEGWEEL
jgi:16S rRNA processing protein RimM